MADVETVESVPPPEQAAAPDDTLVKTRENNVLCALFVALCGPVFDALCALPGTLLDDLPASLRTSSIVLVVLLGSPSIRHDQCHVLEQRAVLAILLAACSFIGLNAAEASARNADSIFSFASMLACIVAVATNGANAQVDTKKKQQVVREHTTAFFAALLFYLGMRTLRHALALPAETLNFKVTHLDVSTHGYAISSDLVIVGNAFAGSVSIAFACIVLVNYDLVFEVGSDGLASVAGVLSCFIFTGALFAQLAAYSLINKLPALFSDDACIGTFDECTAAYRARRYFMASSCTAVPWVCAISVATFALSQPKRHQSRRQYFEYVAPLASVEAIAVMAAAFIAVALVFFLADPVRPMLVAQAELALLITSIPAALLGWPVIGCILHSIAQIFYIDSRVRGLGFSLTYYTHWSLAGTLALTVIVAVLTAISYLLYNAGSRRLYAEPVEKITATCLTALVSVQSFLTLGTLGMAAGYTGINYSPGLHGWQATGYQFTVQHTVSFFFAAALYATRYEHNQLSTTARRAAWFAVPPLLGVAWFLSVLVLTVGHHDPYSAFVDFTSFVVGVSAAAVAWGGCGVFLHV